MRINDLEYEEMEAAMDEMAAKIARLTKANAELREALELAEPPLSLLATEQSRTNRRKAANGMPGAFNNIAAHQRVVSALANSSEGE